MVSVCLQPLFSVDSDWRPTLNARFKKPRGLIISAMEPLILVGAVLGLATAVGGWTYLRGRPARAQVAADGVQEASVVVRDDYRPATIVVRCGVPLRLTFRRDEDNPCSRRVIFPDFGVSRSLPAWRTTSIDLLPDVEGEFLFTCEMGMYQGTIVVRGQAPRWARWPFGVGASQGARDGPQAPGTR